MRKKPLVFLAFCALTLTACSYNPFNDFTGIDFSFSGSSFNVTQYNNMLIWDRNENCDYYEVYFTSASASSVKTTSSNASAIPNAVTTECYTTVDSSWAGGRAKVVGYSLEGSGLNSELKQVCSKTINIVKRTSSKKAGSMSDPIRTKTFNKDNFSSTSNKVIYIESNIDEIYIENVTSKSRFVFNTRSSGNNVIIHLSNANMTYESNVPVFEYDGNNNIDFYFDITGTNTISSGVFSAGLSNAPNAISLPSIIFYSGDGNLTVTGGSLKNAESSYKSGYAIKTNKIVNFLEKEQVMLVGGSGGNGNSTYKNGGNGQMPINSGVKVLTAKKATVGLQAGNGGDGYTTGNGGNAYSYSYLVNKAYKKYAASFYKIKEASPGAAGPSGIRGSLISD